MTNQEQSQIWGNFWQIMDVSKNYLTDYESLIFMKNNNELSQLSKRLPHVENALIDALIIHIAKIFSDSPNESFRLGRFKEICQDELKKEIEKIETNYAGTIAKIVTNRNKLIAHLDKKFFELCFSEKEKERMQQDWDKNPSLKDGSYIFASMPTASDKGCERYSARDFRDDFPQIKEMLEKLNDIWNRSIPFVNSSIK